jgi:hypothetical protein
MQTKLTLRLDQRAIEAAKRYAHARDTSVSQLVTDYFAQLDAPATITTRAAKQPNAPTIPVNSTTNRLRGLLISKNPRSKNAKSTVIDEASYRTYLDEKYR